MLTKMPAVVGPQRYDGVVLEVEPFQFSEDLADLRVHVADAGPVGVTVMAQSLGG